MDTSRVMFIVILDILILTAGPVFSDAIKKAGCSSPGTSSIQKKLWIEPINSMSLSPYNPLPFDPINLIQNNTRKAYAVIRDQFGNWFSPAKETVWESSDPTAVFVTSGPSDSVLITGLKPDRVVTIRAKIPETDLACSSTVITWPSTSLQNPLTNGNINDIIYNKALKAISIQKKDKPIELSLFRSNGTILATWNHSRSNGITVFIPRCAAGVFFLRVKTGEGISRNRIIRLVND